jgi:hypothetical protein
MEESRKFLQRVVFRQITTLFTVSEMLECGHRFESLGLVGGDPLIAKHRSCSKCASLSALPPKKPVTSIGVRGCQSKVSGGSRYDPPPLFKPKE